MNKELTPLECVEYIRKQAYGSWLDDELDIIETALKSLEEELRKQEHWNEVCEDRIATLETMNKRKDEVLRIIKEKRVNMQELYYSDNVEEYNEHINHSEKPLTQTEYDLLKEVLL